MNLTERELAAILAGLRLLQQAKPFDRLKMPQFAFEKLRPLTDREIDHLCAKVNTPVAPLDEFDHLSDEDYDELRRHDCLNRN